MGNQRCKLVRHALRSASRRSSRYLASSSGCSDSVSPAAGSRLGVRRMEPRDYGLEYKGTFALVGARWPRSCFFAPIWRLYKGRSGRWQNRRAIRRECRHTARRGDRDAGADDLIHQKQRQNSTLHAARYRFSRAGKVFQSKHIAAS